MEDKQVDNAGLMILPPFYPAMAWILALALDFVLPLPLLPSFGLAAWTFWVGAALAGLGGAVVVGGIRAFRAAGTHVEPNKPTVRIVTDGLYRFSRNPIYLGCLCFHVGLCFIVGLEWGLILLPFIWLAFDRLVVVQEEAYLARKFGADYRAYLGTTRRWL
ncbi:methyltransferase family protein [Devosia sp.]|uniref:methyltransferase family protein n=1 Tax=Devosia sp. TaxID=1871048 RepID=UPI002FC6D9DF